MSMTNVLKYRFIAAIVEFIYIVDDLSSQCECLLTRAIAMMSYELRGVSIYWQLGYPSKSLFKIP